MHRIYMDHAATTAADPDVITAMLPYFRESFGNASSLHTLGQEAKKALENAREEVATLIGAKNDEMIFTAGGTESDNIAIQGVAHRNRKKGGHIITTKIEHPAVLNTCKHLEAQGFKVTYLPVDKDGLISAKDVESAIKEDTILITIMHANNEIGTIEPIEEIGKIAKKHSVPFHTDAVQSVGKIPVNVDKTNLDMLSISSHKIYGPKGVGALYIRNGVKLEPLVHGGGHEKGMRSSTENIPGIVGFGKACSLAKEKLETEMQRLTKLRDTLIDNILHNVEESYLDGHRTKRLPNNVNLRFSAIEGESLVLSLDAKGIAASTGSACSSKKLEPSHVLMAIGLNEVEAHGSLRLTLGRWNTKEEVEYVCGVLPEVVGRLRSMSPLWHK
ncbi:MAG: cysteine desulfurase NifS [Thermoplasmata archaeon]